MNPFTKRRLHKLISTRLIVILAALLVLGLTATQPRSGSTNPAYPEPQGYINDYANVLSAAERQQLTDVLTRLAADTGAQGAVVIMPDVEGDTVKGYAVSLFEAWGIGQKGEDNGLLILLALAEREIQVEVGYGLEPILPDGMVGRILDDMVPYLGAGQYGEGLQEGVEAMAARIRIAAGLEGEAAPGEGKADGQPGPLPDIKPWPNLIPFIFVLAMIIMIVRVLVRGRRCPRCGAKMRATNHVITSPTALKAGLGERTYRCPRCGHTFNERYHIAAYAAAAGPFLFGGGRRSGGGGFGGGGFGGFGGGGSGGGGAGRGF